MIVYNKTDVAFINCEPSSTSKTEINDFFKEHSSSKFETESVKSSLWDYFHAFILVTGYIKVKADNNTDVEFRTCTLFPTYDNQIKDWFTQNNATKFERGSIKSSLWEYFDVFILVTGNITVIVYNETDVAFINCEPSSTSKTEINDFFKEHSSSKFETESVKSSLWDYFHAFILVTGYIKVKADNNTDVEFRTCTLFPTCDNQIKDWFTQNNSTKFERGSIKSSLWEYFDPLL